MTRINIAFASILGMVLLAAPVQAATHSCDVESFDVAFDSVRLTCKNTWSNGTIAVRVFAIANAGYASSGYGGHSVIPGHSNRFISVILAAMASQKPVVIGFDENDPQAVPGIADSRIALGFGLLQ